MPVASRNKALEISKSLASYAENERATLAKFASAEHLAHTVAYDLAENYVAGKTIGILDEDGITREYSITPIETENPAILGYILAGTGAENNRVHVVFRGTACKASTIRDLEYGGAGQESFHAEKDLILSQIAKVVGERVSETDMQQKISFSGHSLGGGDAQNCASVFIEAASRIQAHKRYQEKNLLGKAGAHIKSALTSRPSGAVATSAHAPFTMIEEITVNHVNSAGVPHVSAERCNKHAKYLAKFGVKINVRALRVAGDGIQLSGQTNILHDANSEVAHVEVCKVESGHEGWLGVKMLTAATAASYILSPVAIASTLGTLTAIGTFKAHTQHNFVQPLKNNEYLHLSNTNPEHSASIKHSLSNKSIVDNNPISHSLKKLAHTFTNPFVRNRKVSPNVLEHQKLFLSQYEMFKTDGDLIYNEKLFEELVTNNRALNAAQLGLSR